MLALTARAWGVGAREMLVRRMGLQARIVDRPAHGEMIEHLEPIARETEDLMREVVEEAADPRGPNTGRFRLEVEELSDDARLPVQAPVEPRSERFEGRAVLGKHRRREDAIGGDRLVATGPLGVALRIARFQEEERQRCGTCLCSGPREGAIQRSLERRAA